MIKKIGITKTANVKTALKMLNCNRASENPEVCKKCMFGFPDEERILKGLYVCKGYEIKNYIQKLEKWIKMVQENFDMQHYSSNYKKKIV